MNMGNLNQEKSFSLQANKMHRKEKHILCQFCLENRQFESSKGENSRQAARTLVHSHEASSSI